MKINITYIPTDEPELEIVKLSKNEFHSFPSRYIPF